MNNLKHTYGKNRHPPLPIIKGHFVRPTAPAELKPSLWESEMCLHPEHKFPSMMYVPPGKTYEHVCPGCGTKFYCKGSSIVC